MVLLHCGLALLGVNIPIGSVISLNYSLSVMFYNEELTPYNIKLCQITYIIFQFILLVYIMNSV